MIISSKSADDAISPKDWIWAWFSKHLLHRYSFRLVQLTHLPQPDPFPAGREGLAGLGEDLSEESGGQAFDGFKSLFRRLARLLHRRHLLPQNRHNPLLLGQGGKGDEKLCYIIPV